MHPVYPLLLNHDGVETLGVLDVDGLDVAVQLLLGILLVVSSPGDADPDSECNALDAGLPDLLVELGVNADVRGALQCWEKNTLALLMSSATDPVPAGPSHDRAPSFPRVVLKGRPRNVVIACVGGWV